MTAGVTAIGYEPEGCGALPRMGRQPAMTGGGEDRSRPGCPAARRRVGTARTAAVQREPAAWHAAAPGEGEG
jgi:hypothetical protein